MPNRRAFVRSATSLAALPALAIPSFVHDADSLDEWLSQAGEKSLADDRPDKIIAEDEAYWARVRSLYRVDPGVLNLDHGWTNPTPASAIDDLTRNAVKLEGLPAEHLPGMWAEISTKQLRAALARAMRVEPTEIALVRNATEALDTVLLGYKLEAGDEIVCSKHDYYAMLDALEQRRQRDDIVLRMIEPPIPAPSPDAITELYRKVIGGKTKLVLLTHPTNLTGQLLPVKAIADIAHAAGAEVVVDGAQSLGLLDDPVNSLGCDYYGASAHKWLGAPVGLGVLWMRTQNVDKVWPLIPPMAEEKGLARFEWIGTAPEYINLASLPALALHEQLTATRKAARLRYLADLVRKEVKSAAPAANFYATSSEMTAGLTTFEIPGRDSAPIQKDLREKHRILVQAMVGIRSDERIKGLRVSPNVYTPSEEISRFGRALTASLR